MSSDESLKGFGSISSTPHPNNVKETLNPSILSPSKLSVSYKTKRRTKQHISASKAKRGKYESSSSADNIYSSTFRNRTTTSNSKSSPFAANKQKKISFSPIQKCYVIPRKSEMSSLLSSSGNEGYLGNSMFEVIIGRVKEKYKQDNELEDNKNVSNQADSRNNTLPKTSVTDDNERLVESFRSLSTTPEEKQTDSQNVVKKKPEHLIKKKGLKKVKKELSHVKNTKKKSTRSKHTKHIFPMYYPLGWMAIYNVGKKILKKLLLSEQIIISPKKSGFQTYGEWKRMSKEGSLLRTSTPPNKEEEFSLPIEITAKKQRIPRKNNKKQSLKMEKHTNRTKIEVKSEILSVEDMKDESKQIRENSSIPNETLVPQNLSDDFGHLINNPNITIRQRILSTSISEKKGNSYFDNVHFPRVKKSLDKIESFPLVNVTAKNNFTTTKTSGTANKFQNRVRIISDIEFEGSTKIRIPHELLYQFKNTHIVNK